MIRLIFLLLLLSPSTGLTYSPVQDSLSKKRKRPKRITKETIYHDNGELSVEGKKKRYIEPLGCLGPWPVYKKNGRWKHYNLDGKLVKIIVYRKGEEKRVKLK